MRDHSYSLACGAIIAAVPALMACSAAHHPTPSRGAPPPSAGSVHETPSEFCPRSPDVDPPVATPKGAPDTAATPIDVERVDQGWNLKVSGAPLGTVVQALATKASMPLASTADGAEVRVWVRLAGLPLEAVLERLAEASGTVVYVDGQTRWLVSPRRAVELERGRRARHSHLPPIKFQVLEVRQPEAVAPLLAFVALTCNGQLVAAPGRGLILASDRHEALNQMALLAEWADEGRYVPLRAELKSDRRWTTYGVPDAIGGCPEPDRSHVSGGLTVGALLLASVSGNVVVGCGGERRVYAAGPVPVSETSLAALGMRRAGAGVFTTAAVPRTPPTSKGKKELTLRTFQVSEPSNLARVLQAQIKGIHTFVYEPYSAVLVAVQEEWLPAVEQLVNIYEGTPEETSSHAP